MRRVRVQRNDPAGNGDKTMGRATRPRPSPRAEGRKGSRLGRSSVRFGAARKAELAAPALPVVRGLRHGRVPLTRAGAQPSARTAPRPAGSVSVRMPLLKVSHTRACASQAGRQAERGRGGGPRRASCRPQPPADGGAVHRPGAHLHRCARARTHACTAHTCARAHTHGHTRFRERARKRTVGTCNQHQTPLACVRLRPQRLHACAPA